MENDPPMERPRDRRRDRLLDVNMESQVFVIKVRNPLTLIPFEQFPVAIQRAVRKLTTKKDAKHLEDLFSAELSPLAKQLVFSFGLMLLFIGEFIMLKVPQLFGLFYATFVVPLLLSRLITYHINNQLFFFFELSTVNALLLALNGTVLRKNEALWKMNFMTSNGIILWSTIPWKNSLTFSSLNSIASFYVHFLPAVLTYVERHMKPNMGLYTYMCPHSMPGSHHAPLCQINGVEAFALPIALSVGWGLIYLLLTEVIFKRDIYVENGMITSLKYAEENDTVLFQGLNKLARQLKLIKKTEDLDLQKRRPLTVALYSGGQMLLSVFFLSFSLVAFQNMLIHSLYLLFFLAVLVWNGARETYPDVPEPTKATRVHGMVEIEPLGGFKDD